MYIYISIYKYNIYIYQRSSSSKIIFNRKFHHCHHNSLADFFSQKPTETALLPGFEQFRQTYGKLDLDEADIGGTGWFTEDPDEVSQLSKGLVREGGVGEVIITPR